MPQLGPQPQLRITVVEGFVLGGGRPAAKKGDTILVPERIANLAIYEGRAVLADDGDDELEEDESQAAAGKPGRKR